MADNKIRLQKFLSEAGVASRRKAEEMIRNGLVKVNGSVAQIGDTVDPKKDNVVIKGKKIRKESSLRYILLNKPRGYVTTTDDELGRKCVLELVKTGTSHIMLGHLSQENNTPTAAYTTTKNYLEENGVILDKDATLSVASRFEVSRFR